MYKIKNRKRNTVILGGGLAGLSAGFRLTKAEIPVTVIESSSTVGGLSRTITYRGFKFDLGGHRFITKNKEIDNFVKGILKGNYLTVLRKSKIYLNNKFFDYPLKPANALFGLGPAKTFRAVFDYGKEKIKNLFITPRNISLEDWVINNFGRTLFVIYFKEYSEKVWGIECKNISEEWVSKRIEGLSLGVAIKNAFFKFSGRDVNTLLDKFIYPPGGIGEISQNLYSEIIKNNRIMTDTEVQKICHENFMIKTVIARNCDQIYRISGSEFVSSIPINSLIKMLYPPPPDDIIESASRLRYRDLVIVTIMLNKERVTDLTWLYIPEKNITLGRIHEPKNWSPYMAPEGKTHIVSEYFCFQGDEIWNKQDEELTSLTIKYLEDLGLLNKKEVIDSCIIRVPRAYPILEVGYREHYNKILNYLQNFKNLYIAGRTGMFRYYNMDLAIESGLEAAEKILQKDTQLSQ
jgi:protoporphyrinogen oxidase